MSTERSQYGWIQTENIFPSVTSLRHAAFKIWRLTAIKVRLKEKRLQNSPSGNVAKWDVYLFFLKKEQNNALKYQNRDLKKVPLIAE